MEKLEVVQHIDLAKYIGTWYEIARLPFSFEDGCTDVTATYSVRDDEKVDVLNRCLFQGKPKEAKGKAKIVDKVTNAKLKVTFFWPFYGDYWVIGLGDDYKWAVVGAPNRKYLWFLCREPTMDKALYDRLVEIARTKGFDVTQIIKTEHQTHR
jgi:apolipoprotein D and lipocalin family protein